MDRPNDLIGADYPSPSCDERPSGNAVDTIVIHATVLDNLPEVIGHFSSVQSRVSSHYTIDRDGTIVMHVPEDARAWHAGASRMEDGRENVNDFSIGIELVNCNDGIDPFPDQQIQALRDLLRNIISRHPIRYILPHYACAEPRGRKSDPVGFDPSWIENLLPRG